MKSPLCAQLEQVALQYSGSGVLTEPVKTDAVAKTVELLRATDTNLVEVRAVIEGLSPGTRTFEISLMPRFTGRYILNPAKVSLMYFPVIYSNNELKKITVN